MTAEERMKKMTAQKHTRAMIALDRRNAEEETRSPSRPNLGPGDNPIPLLSLSLAPGSRRWPVPPGRAKTWPLKRSLRPPCRPCPSPQCVSGCPYALRPAPSLLRFTPFHGAGC